MITLCRELNSFLSFLPRDIFLYIRSPQWGRAAARDYKATTYTGLNLMKQDF